MTGFAGLVYEITWHRYLANLFGSHAKASSLTLATFLGCLGLGYALFGRVAQRQQNPARLARIYGWCEIGIGLWALAFPDLYAVVFGTMRPLGDGAVGLLSDGLAAIFLMGIPTTLMGATLPLLTQAFARDVEDASTFHARVYGINTAGAFLGTVIAGFYLLPTLGFPVTMYLMGMVNLVAGIAVLAIGATIDRKMTAEADGPAAIMQPAQDGPDPSELGRRPAAGLAFLSGFVSIALQVLVVRLVGLTMGSSEYVFTIVVGVYILLLALGALSLRAPVRTGALAKNQVVALFALLALYFSAPYWPYVHHLLRATFAANALSFYAYHAAVFILLAAVLAVPVGSMGRLLPLLFRAQSRLFTDAGREVGKIYGWNTIGCIAGALVGGYALMMVASLDQVFRIAAACVAATLLLAARPLEIRSAWSWASRLMPVAVLLILPLLPRWDSDRFAVGLFRRATLFSSAEEGAAAVHKAALGGREVIFYRDDPNTSVAVLDTASVAGDDGELTPHSRSLFVNGKSDGNTFSDRDTTLMLAHMPSLFTAGTSGNAAVIGFGTGVTVGTLTLYDEIKHIDCIEIAPAVRDAAPLFDFGDHDVSKSAKLEWHIEDAYRFFRGTDTTFDLIVSEPSNPWVSGVERLFTEEFYAMAKARLAHGGVYAQWFHTYSMSSETFAMIVNTFRTVFPVVRIFPLRAGDLIIVGAEDSLPQTNLAMLRERFERPVIKDSFASIGINSPEDFFARELLMPVERFANAGRHTLDYPKLAHRAGQDFFRSAVVEPREFETGLGAPWARLFEVKSLVNAIALGTNPGPEALSSMTRILCGKDILAAPAPGWFAANRRCRTAVFALIGRGIWRLDDGDPTAADVALALSFRVGAPQTTLASIDDVQRASRLFAALDSEFLPLQPELLLAAAKPCRAPAVVSTPAVLACRAALVRALAETGNGAIARSEWLSFVGMARTGLPASVIGATEALIEASLSAEEQLRGGGRRQ